MDSRVCQRVLSKGWSPSVRHNMMRRIGVVMIASNTYVLGLWTLSAWNISDIPSQLFVLGARRRLPTPWAYLTNWQRTHVPTRAVPPPWETLQALVGVAFGMDCFFLAALLALSYAGGLRTGGIVSLVAESLKLFPSSGAVVVPLPSTKTTVKKGARESIVIYGAGSRPQEATQPPQEANPEEGANSRTINRHQNQSSDLSLASRGFWLPL
eukprot:6479678-Amphidinium_carterae.4